LNGGISSYRANSGAHQISIIMVVVEVKVGK